MRRELVIIFLVIIVVLDLAGCDSFSWQQHRNKEYRFSLLLPRNWKREETPDPDTVLLISAPTEGPEDKFKENINVRVTVLPTEISLSTYFEVNKEALKFNLPSAYDLQEGQIFSGLVPGQWLAFSYKMGGVKTRLITAVWIREKKAYTLTCISSLEKFPKYEPIFKRVLKSMRIK